MATTASTFFVTKSAGTFVIPCEPTPTHTLPLSLVDRIDRPVPLVEILWVFMHAPKAGPKVIREALSKALVPYYPMAGRLLTSSSEEQHVACTNQGAWFVEASAECSLKQVGWLCQLPLTIPKEELLPSHPDRIPVMMQVTRFGCGGFVLGLVFDHTIADGIGIGQFMKAVGEIARGFEQPIIEPIWFREHFPNPPWRAKPPPIVPQLPQLEFSVIDVSLYQIDHMKEEFARQTGGRCSTLDVIMAKLWQCRTRAISQDAGGGGMIQLQFMVNARNLLSHPLLRKGVGYYGNCIYPLMVTAPADIISGATIPEIVTLIKDTKKRLPDEFSRWANGGLIEEEDITVANNADVDGDNIVMPISWYQSLGVTDWRKLGLEDVDFGWGPAAYFSPSHLQNNLGLPPWCIILRPPPLKQGCRLLTVCVKKGHLEAFHDGFNPPSPRPRI